MMRKMRKAPSSGPITVQELIQFLNGVVDKTKVVFSEGCDCTEKAHGATEDETSVEICR